jgi:hypothetical protein
MTREIFRDKLRLEFELEEGARYLIIQKREALATVYLKDYFVVIASLARRCEALAIIYSFQEIERENTQTSLSPGEEVKYVIPHKPDVIHVFSDTECKNPCFDINFETGRIHSLDKEVNILTKSLIL